MISYDQYAHDMLIICLSRPCLARMSQLFHIRVIMNRIAVIGRSFYIRSIFGDAFHARETPSRFRYNCPWWFSLLGEEPIVYHARERIYNFTTRKDWLDQWHVLLKFNELRNAISVPWHEVSETRRVTFALRYFLSSSSILSTFFLFRMTSKRGTGRFRQKIINLIQTDANLLATSA